MKRDKQKEKKVSIEEVLPEAKVDTSNSETANKKKKKGKSFSVNLSFLKGIRFQKPKLHDVWIYTVTIFFLINILFLTLHMRLFFDIGNNISVTPKDSDTNVEVLTIDRFAFEELLIQLNVRSKAHDKARLESLGGFDPAR